MPREIVTIATFSSPPEAEIAKGKLEAEGVEAFIPDTAASSILALAQPAMGGIRLQVAVSDAERARDILEGEEDSEHPYRSSASEHPHEEEVLSKAEQAQAAFDAVATRAFRAAVVGIFLCPGPLQLYAIVKLVGLGSAAKLSASGRRAYWAAWVISLGVLGLGAMIAMRMF